VPTLDWIGKEAVRDHHNEVPYHLLRCESDLSVGPPGEGNLLVEGDNLLALKALLPYYAGKVKCIYIDPPYNTGNEGWVYNDNVNAPEIKKWLHKVVGAEAEDLSRHDKWLCMMYPRLVLLRQFLRDDGLVFVSLDDNEIHGLRALLDDVFGRRNFKATIVWQKRTSPDSRLNLGPAHDYIVVYAKDSERARMNRLQMSGDRAKSYQNPDNDLRGAWASVDLTGQTGHATPSQFYSITTPAGTVYPPPKGRCWALAESTFLRLEQEGRIWFGKFGRSRPRLKKFLSETEGIMAWTWWPNTEVGHNQEATRELQEIMQDDTQFENPKPTRLLRRIISLATDADSIILDSFAGSGTTGHAMLQSNSEDGGTRKFLLIELESHVARSITSKRLARAGERERERERERESRNARPASVTAPLVSPSSTQTETSTRMSHLTSLPTTSSSRRPASLFRSA
jgi:adenine-specific DNA-methyltransferase